MSIIPLDHQRKFERRWAARFLRPPEIADRETELDEGMVVARVARKNRLDERLVPEQSVDFVKLP